MKDLLTIQQASKILSVSAKTLRRWEEAGILIPQRTAGNQRRYTFEQVTSFKKPAHVQVLPARNAAHSAAGGSNRFFSALFLLGVIGLFFLSSLIRRWGWKPNFGSYLSQTKKYLSQIPLPHSLSLIKERDARVRWQDETMASIPQGSVLASETSLENLVLNINVPTKFSEDLTAPNVIYSLRAGDGIRIAGGQTPTISAVNNDPGSAQNIFKNFKVGDKTISAGSNSDTLTFVAGDDISLSTDTSNKKITIAADVDDPTDVTGWKDDGTIIRLNSSTDLVSIGTATAGGKLSVIGQSPGRALVVLDGIGDQNLLVASASGVNKFALDRGGNATFSGSLTTNGLFSNATSTYDIGSAANFWNNLYVNNIYGSGSGISGHWQRSSGVVAPTNITDDIVLGATATSSGTIILSGTAGTISTSQTSFNLINTTATTLNIGGASTALSLGASTGTTTVNNALTVTGTITANGNFSQTGSTTFSTGTGAVTLNGDTTLGDAITDNLTFTGRVAQDSDLLPITTTGTNDLGSSTLPWDNLYVGNVITALTQTGQNGYWQRASGALAPTQITDDLILGATATSSGTIILSGTTGTISTSQTTFNLVNTTATTVNVAGAATTLSLGAATGNTTVNNTLNVTGTTNLNGISNIGDGGDSIALSGTTITLTANSTGNDITANLVDNNTDALDIQQGTNNYININTTDSSENITFGNATTTPTFTFTGGGLTTLTGAATISGTLTLYTSPTIQSTANQTLTIGGNTTGNIVLTPLNGSSGTVTVTGLATGALYSNSGVITSEAQLDETRGGTGIGTYTTGDILYASGTDILAKRAIGGSGQVLVVSGGVPTWGSISGSVCTDCVLTDPGATQTITPTVSTATGLRIAQASSGSVDIFSVTNNGSSTKYLYVDSTGKTVVSSFQLTTGAAAGYALVSDASGNGSWTDLNAAGNAGAWTLSGSTTFPDSATYNVLVGSATVTDDIGKLTVSGTKTGKALAVFNDTGTDQNILVASASGTLVMSLSRAGVITLNQNSQINTTGTQLIDSTSTLSLNTTNNQAVTTGTGLFTVGSNATVTGDIAVNGGDITTSQTTFNLINATATTLNVGGAATTLSLGASTGNTTVNNTLNVTGTTNLNGISNIGDGGDSIALSGTTITLTANSTGNDITANLVDDNTDALDIQQSTNNYININTTNSSENISFGNATTNPTVSFLGSGVINTAQDQDIIPVTATGTSDLGSASVPWDNLYVNNLVSPLDQTGQNGYWQRAAGTLAPNQITDDVITGATATASAMVQLSGTSATISTAQTTAAVFNTTATTLSLGGAATTLNLGTTNSVTRTINLGTGTGADTINIGTGGTTADTINVGSTAGATAFNVTTGTGSQTFASSVATGTTTTSAFVFTGNSLTTGTGVYVNSSSLTQGKLVDINTGSANTLTTGTLLNIASTATSLTSGNLASFDWSPGSSTTATGNLVNINVGANALVSGNIFNVQDNSSNIFSVTQAGITSAVPHNFTAAGDVAMAYDLNFTNPVASYINSQAPLYIRAGETFNSSNLTLATYNKGQVIVDSEALVANYAATVSGKLVVGTSTPAPTNISNFYLTNSAVHGKALAIINQTEAQAILAASQSGIPVFTIANVSGTAANGFTFTPAAASGGVTQAATGSDTNIALSIDAKGSGALNLNNTATGDVLIAGGSSSTGCTVTNSTGDLACAGDLAINGGNITSALTTDSTLTVTGTFTANGTSTINSDTITLGNATTDAITFTARVAQDSDLIPITTTGTSDLGASALPWDNLYVNNIVVPTTGTGQVGYWTRTAGVLSPAITNDVLAATTSATVALTLTQTGAFNALLVEDQAADTTPFVIDQSGNVGIGTTTPTGSQLHILANSPRLRISDNNSTSIDDVDAYIEFYHGNDTARAGWFGFGASASDELSITNQTTSGMIDFRTNNTVKMVLDASGNLGIGTTAPDAALEINHATGDSLRLTYNDADGSATNFTDFSLSSTGALTLTGSAATLGASATAEKTFLTLTPGTITLTAPTAVTSLMETAVLTGATIAADAATTVNKATTLSLVAPVDSTNATITDNSALRILNVTSGAGTLTNQYGLYIEDMTAGATADYGIYIAGADTYALYAAADDIAVLDNLWVGATAETITNGSFAVNGDDAFISGQLGVEGDIFTDADVDIAGGDLTTANTTATLFNTNATTLSLGGAATTALNLGNGSGNYTAINLGSGAGTHTINIAGTGATAADTINIGTGGTGADTINLGSSASTTALNLTSGTGSQTFASSVATGTTTTSAFVFTSNSLTSGTGLYNSSSSITSGKLMDITTGSANTWTGNGTTNGLVDISSSSTAGTASAADILFKLSRSGANANTAHTAYGLYSTVTNTNATSGTNIAAYLSASGATTANYGLIVANGGVGVGDTTPDAFLEVLGTTEQLRLTYTDGTVDSRFTVDSGGDLTINNTGTQTIFADDVQIQGGDLTTNQTTATLFNTTATTLSLGGAATTALNLGNGSGNYTAINLGSGAGTHTINIAGTGATAADTINIGTGGTGADTINLGSSASTTALNFTSGTGVQTFTSNVVTGTTTTSGFVFDATAITSGTGAYFTSDSLTTGKLAQIATTGNTFTTGTLLDITSTSTALTSGKFLNINNGSDIFSVSNTDFTSALPANFTAAGDVALAYDLNFTNQTASYLKSNAPLYIQAGESFESNDLTLQVFNQGSLVISKPFSGSAITDYGVNMTSTDSTSNANSDYNFYSSLALSGNAAKTGIGFYSTLSSSSTTADTLAAVDLASSVTGIMTTGTRNIYGVRSQPTAGAESTGGTTNVYGLYTKVSADVAAGGTVNGYGLYIDNGTFDTDGTSVNTGLYVVTPTGADTNYAAIFAGGNVGIGNTAPLFRLDVANSQTATSSAMIYNSDTGTDSDVLTLKLGDTTLANTACDTGGACNEFLTFLDGNGNKIGKIHAASATGVTYKTTGSDFAEYFTKQDPAAAYAPGTVMCQDTVGVRPCQANEGSKIVGPVSETPAFLGGIEGADKVVIALSGQITVQMDQSSPIVAAGDLLTVSANGLATKATKPGFMLGRAQASWIPGQGSVSINITNYWADPNQTLAFDGSGNLAVSGTIATKDVVISTSPQPSPTDNSFAGGEGAAAGEVWARSELATLHSQIASISAQLADLAVTTPPASASADLNWQYATASGQLATIYNVQVPELTVTGKLTVGLLTFDDLAASISSLTGTVTVSGDLAVTGSVKVLGASAGKATVTAGATELLIQTSVVATDSAVFVTPVDTPIPLAAAVIQPGEFKIVLPASQSADLKVNWWVVN